MEEEKHDPLFYDAFFRQKKKHGKFRVVEPPQFELPLADTHAHLQMLRDPSLAIARAALHGVRYLCTIADPTDDAAITFDSLEAWCSHAQEMLPVLLAAGADDAASGAVPRTIVSFDQGQDADDAASEAVLGGAASGVAQTETTPDAAQVPPMPKLRIAVGCHPHNARLYDSDVEAALLRFLADPRVAALGEVGLDYHYDLSPRPTQASVFKRQIELAHMIGLPLALHVRDAHEEAFHILEEEGFPEAGVLLHCFYLDWETLRPWLEKGCYAAFGGALTFKKFQETRDAAARMPLNRVLTETDAPFMAPEPLRGMDCEPAHVLFTAARLAEVRGAQLPEERNAVLGALYANALELLDREPNAWQLAQAGVDAVGALSVGDAGASSVDNAGTQSIGETDVLRVDAARASSAGDANTLSVDTARASSRDEAILEIPLASASADSDCALSYPNVQG